MAAPPAKTLRDLNGQWYMNKTLSDSPEPALLLQGVGWLTRKAIVMASVHLDVKEYESAPKPPNDTPGAPNVTYIEIVQTASGLTSTTENRTVDFTFREHTDWLFGHVKGRTGWCKKEEFADDKYLSGNWDAGMTEFLKSDVESLDRGWKACQVWGFQEVEGERRYCRNVVVTKEAERVEFRMVYDWYGERVEEPEPEAVE